MTTSTQPRAPQRRFGIVAAVVIWGILVAGGIQLVARYSTAAGAQDAAPVRWPVASILRPELGQSTLVMFVHPGCPCSRASLNELNVIMNEERGQSSAFVVFLHPDGVGADWAKTSTWQTAANIPRTTRVVDHGGIEAKRFGALTSGHLVVYDATGQLQFAGGITASRGHEGDNVGRQTVLAALHTGRAGAHGHEVFGCAFDSAEPVK